MSTSAFVLFFIISSSFNLNHVSCAETDTLKPGKVLRDWEQLVSSGKVFRLGFFNPNPNTVDMGPSGPQYLGIWFDNIPFYSVWVANRENPVPDSSGALSIGPDGKLTINHQGSNSPIIINPNQPSAPPSNETTSSSIALTLLDSGNLVIRRTDRNGIPLPGSILWQSFDYPHNMLLPGMKLGANLKMGQTWELTSWLSDKVPSRGAFKLTLDPSGTDQLLVWRRGKIYWSTGPFKNGSFQNATSLTGLTKDSGIHEFKFVKNSNERYFTYSIRNGPALSRMDLDTLGQITLFTLDRRSGSESWIFGTAGSPCPAGVGNEGICLAEEGGSGCRNGTEVFVGKRGLMIGEERFGEEGSSLSLSDCHGECWRNCSCVAYQATSYDQTGCRFWSLGSNFTADDFIGLNGIVDVVYLLKSLLK